MMRSTLAWTAMLSAVFGVGIAYAQQGAYRPAPQAPDQAAAAIVQQRMAILSKLTPVTDAMLRNPPPGEWLQWRRTYDEHGDSPLTQIDKSNVKNLTSAWTWSLPPNTAENVPLVHDGVMFVYGTMDHIQALDATTGDLLWEYVRPALTGPAWPGIAGQYRRNFALYGDKLYFPTWDGHEVALDAKTGKVVWDHQISDRNLPYRASSGPLAVNGKIIQGFTNCSRLEPGGCIIVALDANTGNELWRVHTIPKPGEPGDDTWKGVPYEQRQGAGVWTTPSYDPQLNLIYVGTGNTYAWQYMVHGDTKQDPSKSGLYIDSTLAINADTGKLVWYYQHLPQDTWNLDWAFERTIETIPIKGKLEKVVCGTGKIAWTDCMDAATGKWLFYHDVGLQNIVQSVDPKTGRKTYYPQVLMDFTHQRGSTICGQMKNWPSSAYDDKTHILYTIVVTTGCSEEVPDTFGQDRPYTGGEMSLGSARRNPAANGNNGLIEALDLSTDKVVWTKWSHTNMSSAALLTDSGLLFAGDADRWFRAYDASDGAVLWQARLNQTVNSIPMTYMVNGKQYIAVIAGKGLSGGGTPDVKLPSNGGPVLWVFALP